MKLSTFYSNVAKHMRTNSNSKFICMNIIDVNYILLMGTTTPKLKANYLMLMEAALKEVNSLLQGHNCITTALPSIYETRKDIVNFDHTRDARNEAYRRFILKFLAARAKLAGN